MTLGKVDQKGELEKLYGPVDPPPPKPEEPPGRLLCAAWLTNNGVLVNT